MGIVVHDKRAAKKQTGNVKSKGKPAKTGSGSAKSSVVGEIRKRLQLNQAVFARLVPVSVRSLATLESGHPPTEAIARRLNELRRLTSALSEVMKKDSLGNWLQTPNAAFDGLKPLEVIDRG